MTPLDDLCPLPFHLADAPARARVLSRLADTELFAALVAEPAGDTAELRSFDLAEGRFALACDIEERLAAFVGGPVAYLALPGRVLAAALADEGQGLVVNPGHPSQLMLDAETLRWVPVQNDLETLSNSIICPFRAPPAPVPPEASEIPLTLRPA